MVAAGGVAGMALHMRMTMKMKWPTNLPLLTWRLVGLHMLCDCFGIQQLIAT